MAKLIVANWKMNPSTETEAIKLARASDHKNVVICPPFVYVSSIKYQVSRAQIGAQDVFWENPPAGGPYTGEISAVMLKHLGVRYVIIGHSERRRYLHETDEMVNKKLLAALKAGLKVILCVGEPLAIRRKGIPAAKRFVKKQLLTALKGTLNLKPITSNLIVTYEPVWAISGGKNDIKGRADKPEEALEMVRSIRKTLLAKPYSLNPRM
ncbi:MAG: triose-phosphate isomerase, partial [Patescibacteria group bacterium]